MPTWVNQTSRSIEHITIAIKRLWIFQSRYNRIRAQEASQLGVVPTRPVITQPLATGQTSFVILTGEAFGRRVIKGGSASIAAEGQEVVAAAIDCAVLVDEQTTTL